MLAEFVLEKVENEKKYSNGPTAPTGKVVYLTNDLNISIKMRQRINSNNFKKKRMQYKI